MDQGHFGVQLNLNSAYDQGKGSIQDGRSMHTDAQLNSGNSCIVLTAGGKACIQKANRKRK